MKRGDMEKVEEEKERRRESAVKCGRVPVANL